MLKRPSLLLRRPGVVFAMVLCALTLGCATKRYDCGATTVLLKPEMIVDLSATSESPSRRGSERKAFDALVAPLRRESADGSGTTAGSNEINFNALVLSGGGSYGAFSAGVLNGWTASGTRPAFDVVAGTSTGALIAPMAFVGPSHDGRIREAYTHISAHDIFRKRCKASLLWSDSVASSEPLQRHIASNMDACLLAAVAKGHRCGRRLYVGTTNLDTGRLVIWDLGAIASSGRPDALHLFRQVVLASASVPGFFPPVPIEICVNGRRYTELHVDGGTTSQVFLRASMLNINPDAIREGRKPLAGARVYIIIAGKTFPDPKCVKPRLTAVAEGALGALTSAQTRNDIVRIFTLSLLTGMEFRMSAIPQDFPVGKSSMEFDPRIMKNLYNQGYHMAACGQAWRDTPPVIDPSEQSIPRHGTQFLDLSEMAR